MKKLLILMLLINIISCGKSNKPGELRGIYEIIETNCNTQDMRRRIVEFLPYNNRIEVKFLESTAHNFQPFRIEGEYRRMTDKDFEIYADLNTFYGRVSYNIFGSFRGKNIFYGEWIEKTLDTNAVFTCNIEGRKLN